VASMEPSPACSINENAYAVVCVDGITRAVIKGYTPDISWSGYAAWLRARRPGLQVVHLQQPYDWFDIITGPRDQYNRVEHAMLRELLQAIGPETRYLALFGFSLGGLTALKLAYEITRVLHHIPLDYAAFVSLGTPFAGTGRPQDVILRRAHRDYFQHMLDSKATRMMFDTLLNLGRQLELRMLIGEILHDEIVSATSSLRPVHWLSAAHLPPSVKWGTFQIGCEQPLRAHDGLLSDHLAWAYIDGLIDGLLPPAQPMPYTGNI
jgi:hypothetical protein